MNIQKLFHVLVLGGAAITACGDDTPSDTSTGSDGGDDGEGSGAAATTTSSTGNGGPTNGGAGGTSDGGAVGAVTSAGGGDAPTCSERPSPTDPCGCPCCWADCPNTDETCCAGFCASGNDDAGCCGL